MQVRQSGDRDPVTLIARGGSGAVSTRVMMPSVKVSRTAAAHPPGSNADENQSWVMGWACLAATPLFGYSYNSIRGEGQGPRSGNRGQDAV